MELTETGATQSKEEHRGRRSRQSGEEDNSPRIVTIAEEIEERIAGPASQDQEEKPLLVINTKAIVEDRLVDESLDHETYSPISGVYMYISFLSGETVYSLFLCILFTRTRMGVYVLHVLSTGNRP